MDILELRKKSSSRLEELQNKFKQTNYNEKDERFWSLTMDKTTKIGSATIRFLGPAKSPDGGVEQLEYQIQHSHFFKVGNKWYAEPCPSTIGRTCPVCEANAETWNNDKQNYKSERSRKTVYIVNILVINDPSKPENNGKVFLWKCPKAIFNKIQDQISPKYEDQKPVNVFDMWEGADFRIRTVNKGGFVNYDNSSFDNPKPIFEDINNSALFDSIWNKLYSLKEFSDEKLYKPYEELEKKYLSVVRSVSTSSNDSLENHEFANKSKISDNESDIEEVPWVTPDDTQEVKNVTEDDFFGNL